MEVAPKTGATAIPIPLKMTVAVGAHLCPEVPITLSGHTSTVDLLVISLLNNADVVLCMT